MKMKKKRLDIEYTYDFELLGILSSAKGYKLAWDINNHLSLHLIKLPDLKIEYKNNVTAEYGYFAHESEVNVLKLFRNKPNDSDLKTFLVPEFPHYDYILFSKGDEQMESNRLRELLRNIPSIELVAFIPLDALKTKETFIF